MKRQGSLINLEAHRNARPTGAGLRHDKQKGQISILILFSLVPMFTLFAFVINIGMLVHAKINLQNAVDLAAYAGAATQARQLTNISHINYQMRQAYKKLIQKYYVVGNLSQKCFPRDSADRGVCTSLNTDSENRFDWINRSSSGGTATFPGVPSVCISLDTGGNVCQIESVRLVTRPPCGAADPACGALQNAADGIRKTQAEACTNSSIINQEILFYWVYGTHYDSRVKTNANLQGLVGGDIGVVTENLLNYSRIKNVVDYLNVKPFTGLSAAKIKAVENNPDPAKTERTLMAYRTLIGNLNSRIFEDRESISMDELLPTSDLFAIDPIAPDISLGYTILEVSAANPNACDGNIDFLSAKPYVGVKKRPNSLVYYAVKATAKARLLFNPFPTGGSPANSIELTAYAAAMPFGSRIGPDLSEKDFVVTGTASVADATAPPPGGRKPVTVNYPGLKIDEAQNLTYESQKVLYSIYTASQNENAIRSGTRDLNSLIRANTIATLPDMYEIGRYNIPVDSEPVNTPDGPKTMLPYFMGTSNPDAHYTFWAPIVPLGKRSEFEDELNAALDMIVRNSSYNPTGASQVVTNRNALKDELKTGIGKALTDMKNAGRSNVFGMPDPLATAYFKKFPPIPTIPGKLAGSPESNAPKLATSYTTERDTDLYEGGRVGYSVKLIPFKVLLASPGKLTNDGSERKWPVLKETWNGAIGDLRKVQH